MEASILKGVKKNLGLAEDYDAFDHDVITFINSALGVLTQIGIGPSVGFMIEDATATWDNLLGEDPRFAQVKSFVTLHTKLAFDPPATSFGITAVQEQLKEMVWRLEVMANPAPALPYVPLVPEDTVEVVFTGGGA